MTLWLLKVPRTGWLDVKDYRLRGGILAKERKTKMFRVLGRKVDGGSGGQMAQTS